MALNDKDIDEDMAADWAEISAKFAREEPEAPAADPNAAAAPIDGEETPVDDAPANPRAAAAANRSRTDEGQFAKEKREREAKAAKDAQARSGRTHDAAAKPAGRNGAAAQPDASGRVAGADDGSQAEPPAAGGHQEPQTLDINRPPSGWKPGPKAKWSALSEDVRSEILRREGDYFRGTQQLRPDADMGRQIREVSQPFHAILQTEGGNPVAAFRDYLNTASTFRIADQEGKQRGVLAIIERFGIDRSQLIAKLGGGAAAPANGGAPANSGAQPGDSSAFRDPRVDTLMHQMQTREQQEARAREQAAQRERSDLEGLAGRWMSAVDAKGQMLRPYIDNVFDDMNVIVPQVRQANPGMSHEEVLQTAYDKACWANPEVREVLQGQRDQQRSAANRQKVANARRASSVNVPRRASTPNPAAPVSMDDTLRDTARELGLIS